MKPRIFLALLTCLIATVPFPLLAQGITSKPIRIVVGFPPGGTNDVLARAIAPRLSERLRQSVVVDNRPGATGIIGADFVAKSPPDGQTMLLVSVVHAINPSLHPKLPYDTVKDFTPVILVAAGHLVLVIHPSLPVRSVKELTALVKARPNDINYASTGVGSSPHLVMELYKSMAGIQMTHIPYKGMGTLLSDLLSGQIPLMFTSVVAAQPHIKAAKLRALAIAGAERISMMPDLPTMAESGLPGFEASTWFAVFLPGNAPQDVVTRLNNEIAAILKTSDMREYLASQGVEPVGGSADQLPDYIKNEIEKWRKVVKLSGAKPE